MIKKFLFMIFCLCIFSNSVYAKPITLKYDDGIYYIKLKGKNIQKQIEFVTSDKLTTNKNIHKSYNSLLTINTGFFDPRTGETISYIVTDGKTTADPTLNKNFMTSKTLQPHLDKILNRTEFRVLKKKNKYIYEITSHNVPIKKGYELVTSAQGGPLILPELQLEEEFFILKNENNKIVRESASVLHKKARTIIGLKNKNTAYILIFTNNCPKTMQEVQCVCKDLKLKTAMGFDGGSSTSLSYNDLNYVASYSAKGRLLKSFMIVKKIK